MKRIASGLLILALLFAMGCQPKEPTQAEEKPENTVAETVSEKTAEQDSEPQEAEPQDVEKTEILVSAAASLTDVLNELTAMYGDSNPQATVICTYGSSGALQTQIEEGAPSDIFISAAQKQMTALEEKELIVAESKKTLLQNDVVLILPADSTAAISDFSDLAKDEVTKVGLGEPESVPVGQYSEEILNFLQILDAVKAKAVYGSDVRAVLTWVEEGEVDCGIVYKTDAVTSEKVRIVTAAPSESHQPVTYPAAVLKDSKNIEESQAFLDFLSSDEAVQVFEKYGFTVLK